MCEEMIVSSLSRCERRRAQSIVAGAEGALSQARMRVRGFQSKSFRAHASNFPVGFIANEESRGFGVQKLRRRLMCRWGRIESGPDELAATVTALVIPS